MHLIHLVFFFQHRFPSETALYGVQQQFMWGEALMISPVLTEGAVQVDAVIPKGLWYDYYTVSISHL